MTICLYCQSCRNYIHSWRCRAFPDGIPNEISSGKFDHSQPYPGDNGIRYRSREELDARREQVQCFRCKNYYTDLFCRAYPGGIPDEIIDGTVVHSQPYEGDDGIQFEAADEVREVW